MSDLPFTLDQLRTLKAIVEQGSFKRAADSLYLSQPSISLQVQNLERQLDVPLFDRGGRKAELTAAGKLVLRQAEKIQAVNFSVIRKTEQGTTIAAIAH